MNALIQANSPAKLLLRYKDMREKKLPLCSTTKKPYNKACNIGIFYLESRYILS